MIDFICYYFKIFYFTNFMIVAQISLYNSDTAHLLLLFVQIANHKTAGRCWSWN